MTPADAAHLLGIDATSSPEQLEARYQELRAKLEDRIARAPTPGLKEKYRASLAEITTAFETLTLAADASTLPVLQRPSGETAGAVRVPVTAATAVVAPPAVRQPSAPVRRRKGSWEFVAVLILALAVLGGGGWWVMQTRQQQAERARQEADAAAAAKAEADRVAAEAEKDKARQEARFAQLRAALAEAQVRWEAIERELQPAERRLAELRSDLRNTRDLPAPIVAELQAQLDAHSEWVAWLQPYLTRHAIKAQLAKFDAFLATKSLDDAASVAQLLGTALSAAEEEIRGQAKVLLTLFGAAEILSQPMGLKYTFTDAYGRTNEGVTPFRGELPLGALKVRVQRAEGWPVHEATVRVERNETVAVSPAFPEGRLQVRSDPAGLPFEVTNSAGYRETGKTPADLAAVPSGELRIQWRREGWSEVERRVVLSPGNEQTVSAEFLTGTLTVTSGPSGAAVIRKEQKIGVTPLTLELIPGDVELAVRAVGYRAANVRQTVGSRATVTANVELERWPQPAAGAPFENGLGMRFAPVPGTEVLFGIWETRRGDYAAFVEATKRSPASIVYSYNAQGAFGPHGLHNWTNPGFAQDDTHPVVGVNLLDVKAFCEWLTERERADGRIGPYDHYRLPTDAEWSVAVGLAEDPQQIPALKAGVAKGYPWGNQYPPPSGAGNYLDESTRQISSAWRIIDGYSDGYAYTAPVGSFPANRFGLHDLGGNVWEWCADLMNPADPFRHVVRGSGWNVTLPYLPSSARAGELAGNASVNIGFRCVLELGKAPVVAKESIVHFYRPSRFTASGRKLYLTIEGRRYTLGNNDRLTLRVPTGDLAVGLKIASEDLRVTIPVVPGEETYVECDVTKLPSQAVVRPTEVGRVAVAKLKHVEGSLQL